MSDTPGLLEPGFVGGGAIVDVVGCVAWCSSQPLYDLRGPSRLAPPDRSRNGFLGFTRSDPSFELAPLLVAQPPRMSTPFSSRRSDLQSSLHPCSRTTLEANLLRPAR